ncbi:RagB/SusD family nutrient uptake outer membrane protein [Ancylomarina sp. 16SWW S1-10-2]|uniref:RagB/SusD family nutrient uptake outer membrane protein n=1 Tax=Ancylomarina sp. 16SWW S1-10-2 TaxID=2499681 RepID=UPI0012AE4181|nr:RagB/SusD family nutrient uptake outer membrane protein [Ancylomarina sp. 16SWW S1-10-2]MRT93761.1 RagB/SusD family nutrient uptake outer membrane protein [Ancylomarina sp. 16SWW S1-10-2]
MKNIYKQINKFSLALVAAGLILSGCDDYLDQEPLDQVTEAIYYKTSEQFTNASNTFYTRFGWEEGDESSDLSGNLADYDYPAGKTTVPTKDDIWRKNYIYLRGVNQLIEKAVDYPGEQSEISASLGTAYFFRAWHHNKLLLRFGGVPIVTRSLDVTSDEIYGARNSRYEVVSQMVSDLDMAISLLPAATSLTTDDQGKISAEAAKAFKARILLHAATWEKYVGTTTDGDGKTTGAGSAKPANYPSVDEMLTEAKKMASEVMNSGAYELWDKRAEIEAAYPGWGDHHLFYFFCLEDGTSNPAGLTKADNKEFIIQTVYDYVLRQNRNNTTHAKPWGPSRKLMDMYLCSDGLPVQYSPEFEGYDLMNSEFQNRDLRLVGLVKEPIKEYWGYGSGSEGGGAQYNLDFADLAWDFRYIPNLSSEAAGRNMGYEGRKLTHENAYRETREQAYNFPLLRYAEVLLIYAEATCELGDGAISDADLDLSINKIRYRSGVADLTNALISPFGDLTMLGEIRRERAIELFGENFRYDDLKRWGIAEEELNKDVCVTYITGTEFETALDPGNTANTIYNASAWSYGLTSGEEATSSYAGIASTKAGALIIDAGANRSFKRMNYVDPIPSVQLDLNSSLKQNSGY